MRTKLIEWQAEHGLTGKYVADKIGVSEATWSMIKRGKQNPTVEQISRFRDVFGVDNVLDLFGERSQREKEVAQN